MCCNLGQTHAHTHTPLARAHTWNKKPKRTYTHVHIRARVGGFFGRGGEGKGRLVVLATCDAECWLEDPMH